MNFLLVPIPGQSPWVREESRGQYYKSNISNPVKQNAIEFESKKRAASDLNRKHALDADNDDGNDESSSARSDHDISLDEQKMDIDHNTSNKNLKIETKCQLNSLNVSGDTNDMFTRLSETYPGMYDEDDICCLARIYNCDEGADLKLNDIVEVIGIYTVDQVLNDGNNRGNGSLADMMDPFGGFEAEEEVEEDQSESLPPPRWVHCGLCICNHFYIYVRCMYVYIHICIRIYK
jgi:hypothetical protein